MVKVEAPVVGGHLDTNNPVQSALSIAMAAGGVGLAVLVARYGRALGDFATDKTDEAMNVDAPEVF